MNERTNKLKPNTTNDSKRAAEREIKTLQLFKHKNIVRLLGYACATGSTAASMGVSVLVYEAAERGGLDDILRDDEAACGLDWTKRVGVILGIARALHHLHSPANRLHPLSSYCSAPHQ